ncbi:unnamed protein product [Moneuplotes crassus]|uniref:Uncharacterized protein n=1 Tax=Euplotes crassus TaxID=5936 RepID=A0AAD1XE76_EUPCR|nr:unnamed protein product [Moneuplotes crassus]
MDTASAIEKLKIAQQMIQQKDSTISVLQQKTTKAEQELGKYFSECKDLRERNQALTDQFEKKENNYKARVEVLEDKAFKSAENFEKAEIERMEKVHAFKQVEEKMEEMKNQLKIANKKVKELETSEALTKWKFTNYETTIDSLKTVESELRKELDELKKINIHKEHKISTNIQLQDEITEEKNSYKLRYDKLFKQLGEAKKDITHWRKSYENLKTSMRVLKNQHSLVLKKIHHSDKVNVVSEMGFQNLDLQKEIKELKTQTKQLQSEKDILEMKLENKTEFARSLSAFGSQPVMFEARERQKQDLLMSDPDTQREIDVYKARMKELQNSHEKTKKKLNSQILVNQKMSSKVLSCMKKLEKRNILQNKCDFYYKEIQTLKNENRELHNNFSDLLKENSSLIQEHAKWNKTAFNFTAPFELALSDGKVVRETYIESLIKENAELKNKPTQKPVIEIDEDQKTEEHRFERKRTRKERSKHREESKESVMKEPANLKVKMLEKRKKELEDEMIEVKKNYEHEKNQFEVELESFKNRLESTSKNYQVLQQELVTQKQKELEKIREVGTLERENIKYNSELKMKQDQVEDYIMRLKDKEMEREKWNITANYYQKELNEIREKHKDLLKLFMKTQDEIESLKNPSIHEGNVQAIEIHRLKLKLEGLDLINKQLNQSVVTSERIIKQIEIACLKEIEKIEVVIKSLVQTLKYQTQPESNRFGSNKIGRHSAEDLIVENEQLKNAIEESNTLVIEMKSKITELTKDMEVNQSKFQLESSQERKKEKEFFMEVIKNFQEQRGGNLQELEKKCLENSTLRAQMEKIEEENEKLTKKNELLNSDVNTRQRVITEQIQKKKEMLEENKELKSKVNMLFSKVDQLNQEQAKIKAKSTVNLTEEEEKDIKSQFAVLKKINQKHEKEIETLQKENEFLKHSLKSLSAAKDIEEPEMDLDEIPSRDIEKEDESLKELRDLVTQSFEMITNSLKNINFKGSSKAELDSQVKDVFIQLRDYKSQLEQSTENLQNFKQKAQTMGSHFKDESARLIMQNHARNQENSLLKKEIVQLKGTNAPNNPPDKKLVSRMFQVVKKGKRVLEIKEKLNQNQKANVEAKNVSKS